MQNSCLYKAGQKPSVPCALKQIQEDRFQKKRKRKKNTGLSALVLQSLLSSSWQHCQERYNVKIKAVEQTKHWRRHYFPSRKIQFTLGLAIALLLMGADCQNNKPGVQVAHILELFTKQSSLQFQKPPIPAGMSMKYRMECRIVQETRWMCRCVHLCVCIYR